MRHNQRDRSTAAFVEELLDLVVYARHDRGLAEGAADQLGMIEAAVASREIERRSRLMLATAWKSGWQPCELARQVRRSADATTSRLGLAAIAADHADRAPSTLDARWIAQLEELELPPAVASTGWMAEWARTEQLPWRAQVGAAIALLQSLAVIAPLAILIPPPGAANGHRAIIDLTPSANDPVLNRVRALLAQAESTNYEAEAESFTAKAQELMTRHAIDLAMVSAASPRSEQPSTIRIPVDEPYVDAKSLLLQLVAESSRCRAVFHPRFAMSSVVGFAGDLTAAQTLFTSLLVQAQVAMHAAAAAAPPGTRARSRAFRTAFLTAYAHRIAERLAEINAHVVADAEAETGRSILPVLAVRSSRVDDAIDEMFGRLKSSAVRRAFDPAGWSSGRSAADRAQLNAGDLARPARALTHRP